MLARLVAACALLAACESTREQRADTVEPPAPTGSRGAPVEIPTSRELEEVARLEDARSLGGGRLLELLASDRDARVRARAATALGRFPFPQFGAQVTEGLVRALEDPDLDVRLAAAFALGVRSDPDSGGTLLAYRNDPEPRLRARLVEAASKLPDPQLHPQLLLSLRDADLSVRMEAAVGTARWSAGSSDTGEVDRALLDALRPYRITRDSAPKSAVEAELVWRILWALGRRKAELGRGPFLEYAASEVTLERLFALRGLSELAPDPACVRAAVDALIGPSAARDWRVAYEAVVALGRFAGNERSKRDAQVRSALEVEVNGPLSALEKASEHPSSHVRAGAMTALASFGDQRRVLSLLQRGRLDVSASVRAAALRARVRIDAPDDVLEALERAARDDDPVLRAAAADGAGAWRDPRAAGILLDLARDPSLFVSTRAVEQLGHHPSADVRARLHALLGHADNGLRLAAVFALKAMPDASDVPALQASASSASGDGSAEVAFSALQVLAQIGTSDALAAVEQARSDPRAYVRTVASRLRGVPPGPAEDAAAAVESAHEVPAPGKDLAPWRFNPLVEIVTSRGTLVFELFPAEAPLHVQNFLALIEADHYSGLTFHRVVPDFVVQGGDYRGDGNGAKPFQGEALRAEFTPRKTTRGSLGMPRNEDPDSGGSQFFVTHLPTPHLDGRYTIFGDLRGGGEVLDQIEVGDRILSARLLR